jgi:hypothetical protein
MLPRVDDARAMCPECGYPVPPKDKLREWNASAKEYCPYPGGTQCLCRQLSALKRDCATAAELLEVAMDCKSCHFPDAADSGCVGCVVVESESRGIAFDALLARLRSDAPKGGGE